MFNEVHSIHGHTLLLITKPSLQATALLQHLKQSLAITGKLHNIQRSLDDISSGSIIPVSYTHLTLPTILLV